VKRLVKLIVGACLLLATSLFNGCGKTPDHSPDGRVIVTYWEKWTGFELAAMQGVVDDYNKSQNKTEVRLLAVSQIDVKLLLAVSGGNPPDLAGLWNYSIPDYSEKGALLPLDGLLAKRGVTEEHFSPNFIEMCKFHGFWWGLPISPMSVALHYNRALFRQAGLDPNKPPRTLEELEKMSEQLTIVEIMRNGKLARLPYSKLRPKERNPQNFRIVQAGHLPQQPGMWLPMWGVWFGGRLADTNGNLTITDPGNIAAFRWMYDCTQKYGVNNLADFSASFGGMASAQDPFLSGKVAMILQGVWMNNFIAKYAPGLDWDVAPFPAIASLGKQNVTIVETDVLVIPAGARHPQQAADFMAYLARQDVAEKLAIGLRKFTALKEVSADFYRLHPNPHIDEFVRLSRSPNAVSNPRLTIWREMEAELRVAGGCMFDLSATPENALAEAQRRCQWRLDRVNRRWDLIKDQRLKEWSSYDQR